VTRDGGSRSEEAAHTCPNCGYALFDDDEEFVSGGGVAVSHSVDDGVFIEEHSCPECGHVLARNYDRPDDIRTDGGSRTSEAVQDSRGLSCPACGGLLEFEEASQFWAQPYEYRCRECSVELLGPHPAEADEVTISQVTRLMLPVTKLRVRAVEYLRGWLP
jgi:predicted RNA-binding Zn-ribbon protein involved in translation (DUF1610 family)